jgi:hypothetical protein
MGSQTFRLSSPARPRPRSPAEKPDWWLGALQGLTRAHREARALTILEAGRARAAEAELVREAVTEGMRDELGLLTVPGRALPGGSPEVVAILRRWDSEVASRSTASKRFLRDELEGADEWAARVLAECERRVSSAWHVSRAAGQRQRFERVGKCATETRGVLSCVHCREPQRHANGAPLVLRDLCGAHLLCARCRKHRERKHQQRFARSRAAHLEVARKRGLTRAFGRRDPLTERFLTLTCPHLELQDGGPEAQARIVRDAFRRFMNSLRNHWRGHRGFKLCRYVRVIEATSGRDELGHVHIHAWIFSPFVRVQTVRALWGRALLGAGFPRELWPEHAWKDKAEILDELDACGDRRAFEWAKHTLSKRSAWPRVDLKRVNADGTLGDGSELAKELIKYLCKDVDGWDKDGAVLMHPATFAAVYRGLDGGRMLTASRGMWVRYHAACQCCGAVDQLRPFELEQAPAVARAPPLAAWQRHEEAQRETA